MPNITTNHAITYPYDKVPLRNQKRAFQVCPKRNNVGFVTNTKGHNILKNCDPSHEHKFLAKTRDQPEPGSFFPCSLWRGEMKIPGNEVAKLGGQLKNFLDNLSAEGIILRYTSKPKKGLFRSIYFITLRLISQGEPT